MSRSWSINNSSQMLMLMLMLSHPIILQSVNEIRPLIPQSLNLLLILPLCPNIPITPQPLPILPLQQKSRHNTASKQE